MSYKFEKLEVWKDSRVLVGEVYRLAKIFPNNERFGLTDQIRRAAVSVVLNIAEGSMKYSDADFVRFLRISLGSICELVTALYIALDQEYIKMEEFEAIYEKCNQLSARISAMINKLRKDCRRLSVDSSLQ
jgi:four helix bundle protein